MDITLNIFRQEGASFRKRWHTAEAESFLKVPPLSSPLNVSSVTGLVSNLILLCKLQKCQVFLTIPLPSDYPFKQC